MTAPAVTLRLPLADDDGLIQTTPFDWDMSALADRHYSRRTVGARQFLYNGKKLVLRNPEGTVLFGWMYPDATMRMDGQDGYNCAIFRNESTRKASDIILAAEARAFARWGPNRLYTYVDPAQTPVIKCRGERVVGFCFIKAGWHDTGHVTPSGKHLLVKESKP